MPLRILHIFDHSLPKHSGYTYRSLAILREQQSRGYETLLLSGPRQYEHADDKPWQKDEAEHVDGWQFWRTSSGPLARIPGWGRHLDVVVQLQSRIKDLIGRYKIDVVHAHSPALNGLAALRAAQTIGIPVVYEVRALWEDAAVSHGDTHAHSLRYRWSRALESYVLKRADAAVVICEGLRHDVISRGIPTSKVTVVPNAVDPEEMVEERTLQDPWLVAERQRGSVVLGFIGSFYAYEGLHHLLALVAAWPSSAPPIVVVLIGDGPQTDRLRREIVQRKLEDRIRILGPLHRLQALTYYQGIDICVYPRDPMPLTDRVTPLKPLEAMAHNCLVLASDVAGHRELITHDETGFLFKAGDVNDALQQLQALLARKNEWPRLKQQAKQHVLSHHSWPHNGEIYEKIYRDVLSK